MYTHMRVSSVHADAVLASCSECCIALVSDAERMHAAVSALSPDGASLPDRAEWAGTVASLQHALHAYLASVTRFSEVRGRARLCVSAAAFASCIRKL